jgi:hypothetical protein
LNPKRFLSSSGFAPAGSSGEQLLHHWSWQSPSQEAFGRSYLACSVS